MTTVLKKRNGVILLSRQTCRIWLCVEKISPSLLCSSRLSVLQAKATTYIFYFIFYNFF